MKRTAAFISIAILFILVISLIAYRSYLQVVADIEGRFNTAQLVLARHIADSLEGMAEGTKREMMIASLIPSIQKGDSRCLTDMQEVYKGLRGNIRYLYRLDENGNVTHVVPQERIREVEERGPALKPLITAPISDRGRPAGMIGAGTDLSSLVDRESRPGMLLTAMNGYAWAVDDRSRFIFHPEEEFVGRDAFIVRKERAPHISFEEINRIMREKMMKGESGTDSYVSGWHRGQEGKIKKLIAFCPFRIEGRHYSLALVTPALEVTSLTRDNFRNTFLLIGIVILTGIICLLVILYIDRQRIRHLEREKELGEEIKESRDYLQNLLETANDLIYTVDMEGKITYINPRIKDYGYTPDELTGNNFLTLLAEKHKGKRFKKTILEGVRQSYEVEAVTKGREVRQCTLSTSPIVDPEGKISGLVAILTDVTEKKRAEEELRKKNQELEDFVYIVSHDLKAPLMSLQGFSSVLLKDYQGKLGEKGELCVKRIKANARRMETLISDLLALSRLGRVASPFEDVSSLEIGNRVCRDLKQRIEKQRIEVSIGDNLPTIRCDKERIYQVFENLVVNAIKFMGDREKPRIEIGYEEKGEFHQFHVRDNGIGIDPRYHGKIFEIFHRLKEVGDEEGTGIGLVIVERIVKNHGGEVWVESEKGAGATFYFTLPKMPLLINNTIA